MNEKNINSNLSPVSIALKLAFICLTCIFLLTGINLLINPIINQTNETLEKEIKYSFFPKGKKFDKKYFNNLSDNLKTYCYYYEVFDANHNLIGYIVSSLGFGYGGRMKVLTAFNEKLKIIKVKLNTNKETPVIGKKAELENYMNMFIDTNTVDNPLPVSKNMLSNEDRDTVTGATLTFNGIIKAIKDAIAFLKEDIAVNNGNN